MNLHLAHSVRARGGLAEELRINLCVGKIQRVFSDGQWYELRLNLHRGWLCCLLTGCVRTFTGSPASLD